MSGVQVVRQTSIDYSDLGASGYSTDAFIKIGIEFRTSGALRLLKGAPLSVFVCLALHEASDQPGASLTEIVNETGYSRPTVIDAIEFLTNPSHKFIDECGTEKDGTQRYRVSAYAWFGNRERGGKKFLPPSKKFFSSVVVGTQDENSQEQQQQQFYAETKKIFHQAGVGEPGLSKLAATVDPERAQMWVDWLAEPPTSIKRPIAYMIKRLSEDPNTDPPGWTLEMWRRWCQEDAERAADCVDCDITASCDDQSVWYRDGTAEIWQSVLQELQLRMSRTVFDEWVRSSRALGWEDDTMQTLVVGVKSQYAKEWMMNRLHTTIVRTVIGIVGRSVGIRYEVY